jgi:hypothetical protein
MTSADRVHTDYMQKVSVFDRDLGYVTHTHSIGFQPLWCTGWHMRRPIQMRTIQGLGSMISAPNFCLTLANDGKLSYRDLGIRYHQSVTCVLSDALCGIVVGNSSRTAMTVSCKNIDAHSELLGTIPTMSNPADTTIVHCTADRLLMMTMGRALSVYDLGTIRHVASNVVNAHDAQFTSDESAIVGVGGSRRSVFLWDVRQSSNLSVCEFDALSMAIVPQSFRLRHHLNLHTSWIVPSVRNEPCAINAQVCIMVLDPLNALVMAMDMLITVDMRTMTIRRVMHAPYPECENVGTHFVARDEHLVAVSKDYRNPKANGISVRLPPSNLSQNDVHVQTTNLQETRIKRPIE